MCGLLWSIYSTHAQPILPLKPGGGPVEIGSGVAGLAYSWVLGRRQEKELLNFRPHNVSLVALGSTLKFIPN